MANPPIGRRLRALREDRGLSQEDLAGLFGFKDRQTVSALETGQRRMTAEELMKAAGRFGVSPEYFTDPFLLAGEGCFSWRSSDANAKQLGDCERRAERWIAAFRTLAPAVGHKIPPLRHALRLDRHARYEDAMHAGEQFAKHFRLGNVPAMRLIEVMEQKLGILILMFHAERSCGISGAACHLPELSTALIARHEAAGRRHFTLAHELFHLLTWETMPPEHFEDSNETGGRRVEQLANCFASAVLMPAGTLARYGNWEGLTHGKLVARLNAVANEMQVTASALKWRLAALGSLPKKTASELSDAALRRNGREAAGKQPPLFSKPFVKVIGRAIGKGLLSYRRAASLLGLNMRDLARLCEAHHIQPPQEL